MPPVAVVLGSQSDASAMEECLRTLERLGIQYETAVISAHRSPEKARQFALAARERGIEVIIAAAGMAAALPGVLASWTALPVIGVPIATGGMSGLESLLAIAQMPPGVPVACMAVGGARNAALFAAHILALRDEDIRQALESYRRELSQG
ncbi:MAG: 5-(carboxyamino)imidazole ribonucleotide mutase [Chloroflexota bacterium]|nr:5-(carboxyamino)imidazole ribonucleotide mutase [Chloroflexota bacterium]